jgi:phosphoribosylformylglycinamidine synthase
MKVGIVAAQEAVFRVELSPLSGGEDPGRLRAARLAGFSRLEGVRRSRLYFLQGDLDLEQARALARELLADPLLEEPHISLDPGAAPWGGHAPGPQQPGVSAGPGLRPPGVHTVEVTFLPGVTDAEAEHLVAAASRVGCRGLVRAATGARYLLEGEITSQEAREIALRVLAHPLLHRVAVDAPVEPPFLPAQPVDSTVETVPLRHLDDAGLEALSRQRRLALDGEEMRALRRHFQDLGRDPTDAEIETLAQTWSEHCCHKTFRARIRYRGPQGLEEIDGLLDTFIQGPTRALAPAWIRSAFSDNAGVVALDEDWDLAFKVETHNHPSALEPFGGASTGVGGVIRDILGVSARPLAVTDVLCFGPLDLAQVPAGVLHPRQVAEGVIRGIQDYGNKMGIPTVSGALFFHPGYVANPLVYCGCLGLAPRGCHPRHPSPGDLIVVLGGRTGRDGLRGATFSSLRLDGQSPEEAGSAVQIGHPIAQKQLLEVVLAARDRGLYRAITDCGAGGLSSAVGEMARGLGAWVRLEKVPLKYPGLRPWEIWLSEAQERMVMAVPGEKLGELERLGAEHAVEVAVIGEFQESGRLRLTYEDLLVGDLDLEFLHQGRPRPTLEAFWEPPQEPPLRLPVDLPRDLGGLLLDLLAHPNLCSRAPVLRRYDHEVQGQTALKPLVGFPRQGPGDAPVLVPLDLADRADPPALALAVGLAPLYGPIDPAAMAWAAVDEALRNLVAVGADPDRVSLLDNFCWGDPRRPDRLGALVRCAQGCREAALAYRAPFISGKDSLNNEFEGRAIPGTLLISALGLLPAASGAVSMDLKEAGNLLYLVGETRVELGGSHLAFLLGAPGGRVPRPPAGAPERYRALHQAMRAGLVRSCHDCSEGGLGVALAEMCLAGGLGAEVQLEELPEAQDWEVLFSESLGRLVVEVRPGDAAAFEERVPCRRLGRVLAEGELRIRGRAEVVRLSLDRLARAWSGRDLWEQLALAEPSGPSGEDPGALVGREPPARETAGSSPGRSSGRRPRVLVLHTEGTNRDREAALACHLAGGEPEIVTLARLLSGERRLLDYAMLVLPGGFSYGDDLGAGRLWALDLRRRLGEDLERFVARGRPVLGICNGFQALVAAGILPGGQGATLAPNASGRFECRWVWLQANPASPCLFTRGLEERLLCPVAHGEGRFLAADLEDLRARGLDALWYVDGAGPAAGYPANPNGSVAAIAGVCNAAGNVLGLMPHPEDHVFWWQHPAWTRGGRGQRGLELFRRGILAAR